MGPKIEELIFYSGNLVGIIECDLQGRLARYWCLAARLASRQVYVIWLSLSW